MAVSVALKRQLQRWYQLKPHPVQLALDEAIGKGVRFPVVPAGRRSGKTERAKRFVARQAMENPGERYFIAAPTRDQVKKIYWADMKALCLTAMAARAPSETELITYLDNGTEVHLIGLDRPERIEGILWTGGVIDEIDDVKTEAWSANIRPALDTFHPLRPDYLAWCWLIGVPDGLLNLYEFSEYARLSGDKDWAVFHWKSSEILPPATIEAAKRQMSAKQFRQEYEASFETATGRIYDDYGPANHTTETIKPHEQLLWYHDFNFTPMSSGVGVIRDRQRTPEQIASRLPAERDIYLLEEIILTSAVARQSAMEFVERYTAHRNKHVIIYGDPAGRAGEKHGHASDYTDMEKVLRDNGWTYTRRVKAAAPAIKDRQNAVRAKVLTAAGDRYLFVNTKRAPYTHKGLATVQLKKGSTFLEEDGEFQHITTAIGYFIDYEFPIGGRMSSAKLTGT